MSKLILECKYDSYVMSLLDDYMSTSTVECKTMDEAIHDMMEIFKKRCKDRSLPMQESMKEILDSICDREFKVDLMGIDMLKYDKVKEQVTKMVFNMVNEYFDSLKEAS